MTEGEGQPIIDWGKVFQLLDADLEGLIARASDPARIVDRLTHRIAGTITRLEDGISAARARTASIPDEIDQQQRVATKCVTIAARSEGQGRPDLQQAALARKAECEARVSALAAESEALAAEVTRAEEALGRLRAKEADAAARRSGLAAPAAAEEVVELDELIAEPAVVGVGVGSAAVSAAPTARVEPAAPAPATGPASEAAAPSDEELERQMAELMASMGVSATPTVEPSSDSGDDFLADIPELVEIGNDELPDGITLEDLDKEFEKPAGVPATAPQPASAGLPAAAPIAQPPASPEPEPAKKKAKPKRERKAKPKREKKAKPKKPARGGQRSRHRLFFWILILLLLAAVGLVGVHLFWFPVY